MQTTPPKMKEPAPVAAGPALEVSAYQFAPVNNSEGKRECMQARTPLVLNGVAPGHRRNLRRAMSAFAKQVIAPRPNRYLSESHRQTMTVYAGFWLAWCAMNARRHRYRNPLDVAHDMAEFAKSAPRELPCVLDRLDFERLALDALHLANERRRGGAA